MSVGNWFSDQVSSTQIVVMAGGKAKRMGSDIPKCLLEIKGKKLLDICIESITKEGFRDFVFLLGHKHEMVTEHAGDGSRYGISAKFSIDPPSVLGWGKGKAFKHALQTGKIDPSKRCIIVFPDDIIMDEKIFSKFLMNHLEAKRKNKVSGSTLLVPGTEYPYGVAEIDKDGIVQKFIEKPFLDKPTSVGVYVFEPEVYATINELINLDDVHPTDLESTIMPQLVSENKLAGYFIENNNWIPINTMKEYEQAIKLLSK